MGVLGSIRDTATAPLRHVLDRAVRDLLDEMLASRPGVRQAELTTLADRLDRISHGVAHLAGDVAAVQQAVAARTPPTDLGLAPAPRPFDHVDARRDTLARDLERLDGALKATDLQVDSLLERLEGVVARAAQSRQLTTTAAATAESATDGLAHLAPR